MRRREFLGLAGAAAAFPGVAMAQQAKVPRIAYLRNSSTTPSQLQAFFDGLADYGYIDGRNIVVDHYVAPTAADLPAYAARAVASRPDVIFVRGSPAARAAGDATKDIPIVFTSTPDPVGLGLVSSLARPTENLTGTSIVGPLLAVKALEVLREIRPSITRVALFQTSAAAETVLLREEVAAAASSLRIEVLVVDVKNAGEDKEPYFLEAKAWGAQAIYLWANLLNNDGGDVLNTLALRYGLPTTATNSSSPTQGGLVSYGANTTASTRRGGYFIDQILKGAKPADLPVEQPTVLELVVNLKTAKALGLTIPTTVLFRADEVIQ